MSVFARLSEALTMCSRPDVRPVRTAADPPMGPNEALNLLKDGNRRFVQGQPLANRTNAVVRQELVELGQAPHTAIIGCADSRAPLETIFDTMPGDIFVLRNAGNTCTHAEGSMVGSLEFCTGKLGSRLVLVLGHTKCGAVYGATKTFLDGQASPKKFGSALEGLLQDLGAVAQQAQEEMGPDAEADAVAAHAVKVNVFHTIDFLLKFSESIREGVRSGQIEIHGGIYHLETGNVEFMGKSPRQTELLDSSLPIPPSMANCPEPDHGVHGVRTGADVAIRSRDALKLLKEGNERFAAGAPTAATTSRDMRRALVKCGQAPHSAIVGCADSRVPVDTVFDAMPGDLFVLRNAGNTCTHAEGSIVGSLEFCTGKLGTQLVLVLGHTQCGAVAGATQSYKSGGISKAPGTALEGLLQGLASVAQQATEDLGPGAEEAKLIAHAVKVNVFHSINFLLKFSEPLREAVRKGDLDIQGGIYHLETGRVEFLGRSPRQAELLSSKRALPPSLASGNVRTSRSGAVLPQEAMVMLKDGNERFATGAPISGKVHQSMREALATVGQAPHTALVGCADSRVPLETVFDALPGDLFVLRNAGNTCTHAEGSVLGSLEFCTGALNTRLIFVLGHTACGAIKGATKAYLALKKSNPAKDGQALDRLLLGLSSVAESAASELGRKATEDEIAAHAVKLNVFHTMNFLLQHSEPIRQKVRSGELEIQGGIYDLGSGRVQFLGQSPVQSKLLKSQPATAPSKKDKLHGA
ncbi:mtcA2 [Symbiodinium pilosum]|uniref:carbonic anhydrase n=1 Tax=Symbiodinium pilosum TaxID=2952 RepID=A0A812WXP7_SYMPI|nr:mtcA2 [Symbiodinium pilosum]